MKYPRDGDSRACYCKREVTAEPALFGGAKNLNFLPSYMPRAPQQFLRGRKQILVQCRCEQILFLQSSCVLVVL